MDTDDPDTDDKPNICPICRRGFTTLPGLKQHWTKTHTEADIQAAVTKNSQSIEQSPKFPPPATHSNHLQIIRNNELTGIVFKQFNIIENEGMGDCLFMSILEFLRNPVNNISNVPKDVLELRRLTVDYIMSPSSDCVQLNFDRFRDSIIINLRNHVPEFATDSIEDYSEEDIQTLYSKHMSSQGIYATATELCAMSEIFGFGFYIIQNTGTTEFECYDYGPENTNSDKLAYLFFTGDPMKGHFRLLTPNNDSSNSEIPTGSYKFVSDHSSTRMTSIMPTSEFTEPTAGEYVENQNSTSQPSKVTNLDELLVLLARCKRHIKVIKRIPRSARISAALRLASRIDDCLARPENDTNWQNLLTFAYTALKVPTRTKKFSLTTLVKRNIEKGDLVFPASNRKHTPISISKRIEHKISDGDVKGAVKLLSSTDTMAPVNEITLEQLKQKHPPPTEEFPPPEPPDKSIEPLTVTEKQVYKMIGKFPNGSSAGIDGIFPQHLKDLTSPITGEAGLILLRAITKLSNFMLAGKIPSEVCAITYGASLCALNKKEGGIRPIAVGNTFRRLTAKLACASVRPESAEKFSPRQLGFGVPGGCEASVHATRTFIKKKTNTATQSYSKLTFEMHSMRFIEPSS